MPLILAAEIYETGGSAHTHSHDAGAPADTAAAAHTHDAEAWAPADGFERAFFTLLANVVDRRRLSPCLLIAASEFAGGIAGWRLGLFWGLAGFAVFTLAPGLGLPPELPAMPAADLVPRQIWWTGTVIATAAGLALIVFGRSPAMAVVGVALLVAAASGRRAAARRASTSPIPEDLHHRFVVAVTLTNLVFWVAARRRDRRLVRPRFAASIAAPQAPCLTAAR